jgi:hypothetical protein
MLLSAACTQSNDSAPVGNQTATEASVTSAPKIIGSDMLMISRTYPESFDSTVYETASAGKSGRNAKIVLAKVESIAQVWEEPATPDDWAGPVFTLTDYNVIVEETLVGAHIDSFILTLLGTPDNHFGITKPQIGDRMILFVGENRSGNYAISYFEDGMFRINNDGTVYSFSNQEYTAQFDGKTLDILENEISRVSRDVIAQRNS